MHAIHALHQKHGQNQDKHGIRMKSTSPPAINHSLAAGLPWMMPPLKTAACGSFPARTNAAYCGPNTYSTTTVLTAPMKPSDFPIQMTTPFPSKSKTGALVFFHGYLLHRSFPNRANSGFRRVLVNHYMSAESLLPWRNPKPGERMATADIREIIMIAGEDPYSYKGTEIKGQPHVRTAGDGGCGDGRQDVRS